MWLTRTQDNEEVVRRWSLSKEEFNQWRRENDLPALLEFFRSMLPHFAEWLSEASISDSEFIGIAHTARFFLGDGPRFLVDATAPDEMGQQKRTVSVLTISGADWKETLASPWREQAQIHGSKGFYPYFHWLRTRKRTRFFPVKGDLNKGFTDDLRYMGWQGADLAFSRASLFHHHPVLKMGGATIPATRLDGRNLDFVDLDGLTVTGSGGSWWTHVAYSSCRGVSVVGADKAFLTFDRCSLREFRVEESRIQDLHFVECDLVQPVFKNSRLVRCGFSKSSPSGLTIDNCELLEFYFRDPPRSVTPQALEDIYKRLRVAYQQRGNRREASQFYFRERVSELRANVSPLIPRDIAPANRPMIHNWSDALLRWRAGQYATSVVLRLMANTALHAFKVLLYPRYAFQFWTRKAQAIPQTLDLVMWGFGERPGYVFGWMAGVIGAWTARYYYGSTEALRGRLLESLSCSAFNFATIGCEYKTSFDSLEGILGATLVGIMVGGFANRTRY